MNDRCKNNNSNNNNRYKWICSYSVSLACIDHHNLEADLENGFFVCGSFMLNEFKMSTGKFNSCVETFVNRKSVLSYCDR